MGGRYSQAKLLKRRVRQVQGRAKVAGIVYMLGMAMLLLATACILGVANTCLHTKKSGGIVLPVLTFYSPVIELIKGKRAWSAQAVMDCCIIGLYAFTLLVIAVCFLLGLAKIGWLFKRRASYVNGFNRNMYAMDRMAKCYSVALIATALSYVLTIIFSNLTITSLNMYGYVVLGAGVAVHFIGGAIGANVTVFTMGKRIQEEERPNGVGIHLLRNILQVGAVGMITFVLLKENRLYEWAMYVLAIAYPVEGVAFEWMKLIPVAVECAAWVCLWMMLAYACSVKEFNRDGMCAFGLQRFTYFAFMTFAALLAMLYWPIPDATAVQSFNSMHVLAAAVAGISCLLNWVLCTSATGKEEEVDVKTLIEKSNLDEE